jgi:hypothetical protein
MDSFEWAVGIFEGEGCITRHKTSRKLSLSMTDEDIVRRFAAAVGFGHIHLRPGRKAHHKPICVWYAGTWTDIYPFVLRAWPLLGERRRKAALRLIFNPPRYYLQGLDSPPNIARV